MRRMPTLAVIVATLLAGCVHKTSPLDQQLDEILAAWTGSYAGEAPNFFTGDGEMQAIRHRVSPIAAPQFGEEIVYYQLDAIEDDGAPLQMKIFVFDTAPGRTANRMSSYIFAPGQAPGDLDEDAGRIAALNPAELMSFPDECALTWSAVDGGFEAIVRAEDCSYPSQAFNTNIRPEMAYRILGDRFELEEALYAEDGRAIVNTNGVLPAFRE